MEYRFYWERITFCEFSSKNHNLSSKEPVNHGDGFCESVVGWDDDVDEFKRGIGTAKGDARDVNIRSLHNCLGIMSGIRNNQQSWLFKLLSILICQSSWGPSIGGSRNSICVLGVFDNCSLTKGSSWNNLWNYLLLCSWVITMTSSGLSMVTMILAANYIFYQVSSTLIRCTPFSFPATYGFIACTQFLVPMWHCKINIKL
jgi:hypothetical protein